MPYHPRAIYDDGSSGVQGSARIKKVVAKKPVVDAWQPAKTVQEAEEWLKDELSKGVPYVSNIPRFQKTQAIRDHLGEINIVGFNKLSLEDANNFNHLMGQANALCDDINIPRVRAVDFTANKNAMGDGVLSYSQKTVVLLKNETKRPTDVVAAWKPGDKLTDRPFTAHEFAKTKSESAIMTFWHEMGHQIHEQYKVSTYDDYKNPLIEKSLNNSLPSKKARRQFSVSKYGDTNNMELFADSFAMYQTGQKAHIPADMIEIINAILSGEF
jgi:hypothetical protein